MNSFPHHNNEIAQTCARNGGCNHDEMFGAFVHIGHLHIEGLKMSKSLKNFITVKDFLSTNSADAFRMFCLLNPYRTNTNFSASKIDEASNVLNKLRSFVEEQGVGEESWATSSLRWTEKDRVYWNTVLSCETTLKHLLSNDVQTQGYLFIYFFFFVFDFDFDFFFFVLFQSVFMNCCVWFLLQISRDRPRRRISSDIGVLN